jgi:predicted nuclease of predicted toxin-antitoxin system
MRFIVDESTGPAVAACLRDLGHEVFSVYEESRGIDDTSLIQKAFEEVWIIITNDKDFGERVYRDRLPHRGVILLRLEDERAPNKIATVQRLLDNYADRLPNAFVVATETKVRLRST